MGNGTKIIDQYPRRGQTITDTTKVFLKTQSNTYMLPNMIGWSKKEVLALANLLNLKITINGTGYVTEQSISENTEVAENSELIVTLNEKF